LKSNQASRPANWARTNQGVVDYRSVTNGKSLRSPATPTDLAKTTAQKRFRRLGSTSGMAIALSKL
jgi:hypothetical protein